MADVRGMPSEFDAGPSKSSGWPELFAATPNYRELGRVVVGREACRWHFGPMFYRGRLNGSARVIVTSTTPRSPTWRTTPSSPGRATE